MKLRTLACNLAVVMMSVTALQAHPGHAPLSKGAKHFLTSPAHVLPALVFAAVVCVAAQFRKNRGERNFVRVIAGLIAVAAIAS